MQSSPQRKWLASNGDTKPGRWIAAPCDMSGVIPWPVSRDPIGEWHFGRSPHGDLPIVRLKPASPQNDQQNASNFITWCRLETRGAIGSNISGDPWQHGKNVFSFVFLKARECKCKCIWTRLHMTRKMICTHLHGGTDLINTESLATMFQPFQAPTLRVLFTLPPSRPW